MELDVGEAAVGSAYQKRRLKQAGGDRPFSFKSRYCRPAQACVAAWRSVVSMVAGAFGDDEQVERSCMLEPTPGRSCTGGDATDFR